MRRALTTSEPKTLKAAPTTCSKKANPSRNCLAKAVYGLAIHWRNDRGVGNVPDADFAIERTTSDITTVVFTCGSRLVACCQHPIVVPLVLLRNRVVAQVDSEGVD